MIRRRPAAHSARPAHSVRGAVNTVGAGQGIGYDRAAMFWFRKKANSLRPPHPELRDHLLADLPLATVADRATDDDPDTPSARFRAAQSSLLVGDRSHARRQLHDLLAMPELDVPTALQAWRCLRELDELPPPGAGAEVRGIVVDFGGSDGLETLAAYEDGSATLLCSNGAVRHARTHDCSIDDRIEALLTRARAVVDHTDPHRGAEEPPPEAGHVCIRVLTWAGTHIGLGPHDALGRDPVGGPVLREAQALRGELAANTAESTH